jgi:hypothetical protein
MRQLPGAALSLGWGELQGPEKMVEVLKGTIELAPSALVELIELLDFDLEEGLGVVRQIYTGSGTPAHMRSPGTRSW